MLSYRGRTARLLGFGLAVLVPSFASSQVIGLHLWSGFGGNAQHTAQSIYPAAKSFPALYASAWSIPIDTSPTYSGGNLLIHYAEPAMTPIGNLVLQVRHGAGNPYTIEAHHGYDGTLMWSRTSTYIPPAATYESGGGPVIVPAQMRAAIAKPPSTTITQYPLSAEVAWAESGGRIAIRANADGPNASVKIHAFYGDANYLVNPAAYDANVKVCTPLTAAADGSIYFGYTVEGPNPLNLTGGLAVIRPNGLGTYISAPSMSGDLAMSQVQYNSAPALSSDGARVYAVVSAGYSGRGYLCGINTQRFVRMFRTPLLDPIDNSTATVDSDNSSSPAVAPDGSVLVGVLEHTLGTNNGRGYLLHYSWDLSQTDPPGPCGWDVTPTIVPSTFLPTGAASPSPWVVIAQDNDTAGVGSGDGLNCMLLLDPVLTTGNYNFGVGTQVNGVTVMGAWEILAGATPDTVARGNGYTKAVFPFDTSSAAADMINLGAIVSNTDGMVYDWQVHAKSMSTGLSLATPVPQAQASNGTVIGMDGFVYSIHNGVLYAY